jgi:hypothetical protein
VCVCEYGDLLLQLFSFLIVVVLIKFVGGGG